MYPYTREDLCELKNMLAEELAALISWEYDPATDWILFSRDLFKDNAGLDSRGFDLQSLLETIMPQDQIDRIRRFHSSVIETRQPGQIEFSADFPELGRLDIRSACRAWQDPSGRWRLAGACQNITDRLQKRRSISNRQLMLDTLLNNMPKPVYYQDLTLKIRQCNKAFAELVGRPMEAIIGLQPEALLRTKPGETGHRDAAVIIKTHQRISADLKFIREDGGVRWINLTKSPVESNVGLVQGFIGIINDMTHLAQAAERERNLSKIKDIVLEITKAILEKTTLHDIFEFALDQLVLSVESAELGSISMLDSAGMLTFPVSRGYSKDAIESLKLPLTDSFHWKATGGDIRRTLVLRDLESIDSFVCVDNEFHESIRSSISAPLLLNGELLGFLTLDSTQDNAFTEDDAYLAEYLRGQLVNAISRFRLYEDVVRMTDHDAQTGLYNRRYFESLFNMTKERCLRYDERFLFAVFDLDGLKHVNDTHGHLAGDLLIQTFAAAVSGSLRASDILARTGGDEFAAVLFNGDAEDVAARLEERRRQLLLEPVAYNGQSIPCSFSFGLARFPDEGASYDALMTVADRRMYDDKDRLDT